MICESRRSIEVQLTANRLLAYLSLIKEAAGKSSRAARLANVAWWTRCLLVVSPVEFVFTDARVFDVQGGARGIGIFWI